MSVDVSVIIAAYNVDHYITRAVESALSQTDVTTEVIIIDDHSTDTTRELMNRFTDPRVTLLQTPQNSGPATARNLGIAAATGSWIAILDGDDAFAPGRLKQCLERAQNRNANIVVDNLLLCPEDSAAPSSPMFPPAFFNRHETLDLPLFIKGKINTGNAYDLGYLKPVFSTDFIRKHNLNYPEDIHIGEDYLLMAAALANGAECVILPETCYYYTVRTGSISHRLSVEQARTMWEADKRFMKDHTLPPEAAKAQKKRLSKLKEQYAYTLLVEGIKQRNLSKTGRALKIKPSCVWRLWEPVYVRLKNHNFLHNV